MQRCDAYSRQDPWQRNGSSKDEAWATASGCGCTATHPAVLQQMVIHTAAAMVDQHASLLSLLSITCPPQCPDECFSGRPDEHSQGRTGRAVGQVQRHWLLSTRRHTLMIDDSEKPPTCRPNTLFVCRKITGNSASDLISFASSPIQETKYVEVYNKRYELNLKSHPQTKTPCSNGVVGFALGGQIDDCLEC